MYCFQNDRKSEKYAYCLHILTRKDLLMNFIPNDQDYFTSFIGLLIIGVFTAYYASVKGKNPFLWFFITCLIGIFAPLTLFILTMFNNPTEESSDQPQMGVSPPPQPKNPSEKDGLNKSVMNNDLERKEEDLLWFYLTDDHQQFGPVSVIALRDLWNTGRLGLGNYVWSQGMREWKKLEELPELQSVLNKHSNIL